MDAKSEILPTSGLQVSAGVDSRIGGRRRNEDYAGVLLGSAVERAHHGVVAALADGVGGAAGGRVAAELAVRTFIDGYISQAERRRVADAAGSALQAVNRWTHAQGLADPALAHMACTFTALILRRREAHVLHVGDSRLYRLRQGRLLQLTHDHTVDRPEQQHVLVRAIGLEAELRLDYAVDSAQPRDRYLLCSDGVHGPLRESQLAAILMQGAGPEETARLLVDAALDRGGRDNATALVLDVLSLPTAQPQELERAMAQLPIRAALKVGETIDGFTVGEVLSEGRYSRLYRATDTTDGRAVVLKLPKPLVGNDRAQRAAFVREMWIGAHLRSAWLAEAIELPPERQQWLYLVMPFYAGETLEQRLLRQPPISLERGVEVLAKLSRGLTSLHRAGFLHRDIKPDNVMLDGPSVRLLDFGSAGREDEPLEEPGNPGTASYMAPELFRGEPASERSELFALGVSAYRMFSGGAYPYGEIEPFSRPRFGRPTPLSRHRRDAPAWLDAAIARAIAVAPEERHADVIEFVAELENGLTHAPARPPARFKPLYERNPLAFWKLSALVLLLLHLLLAIRR
jgi:serine/threonine protein phosphatase PrpC